MVASCLDRHEGNAFSEPTYVETTSAPATQATDPVGAAATPVVSTVVLQAPSAPAPVNITVNNQLPAGTTTTTSFDQNGQPVVAPAANVATQQQLPAQQAPLVGGGIAAPAPLVNGGTAPSYTAAPYGTGYVQPNPAQNPNNALNNASPQQGNSRPGDSTVTNNGQPSNQGGGAGNLGSGGGATTPTTTPTANPAPAPTQQFSTDWGPAGQRLHDAEPVDGSGPVHRWVGTAVPAVGDR